MPDLSPKKPIQYKITYNAQLSQAQEFLTHALFTLADMCLFEDMSVL